MLAFALWSVGALIAAAYCIVRGIGDLRRKKYMAGVIGLGSAAIFLLTPIQTHAVNIDLSAAAGR
ncbi:hypothetical protein PX554_02435 [Sphingomonas sp. H39-1-10]|uniref:hypothetical protein n=1 Tax=Sphingomonas TaxID=13687 RepID=UPI00087F8152|nr:MULTISPECIES: hypothetical protein [Sphingomonas]MDF0486974.1 hypothetical protein [Sphingomonas pollutisoli]SDA27179.1 hypothetical protein SAMN03159340_02127 [Sphingomonas sp. NFR15]